MFRRLTSRITLAVIGLTLLQSQGLAQHTLLINMDGDELTLDNGNGLVSVGTCGEDEVYAVTPAPGPKPSAAPFLSRACQWALLGDADADGRYADDSTLAPGGDIDAIFVRAGDVGPFGVRDIFISKESNTGFAAGLDDGDVFRYAGPLGALEFFVTEAQLRTALGTASTSVDLNALCQNAAGDLFFSCSLSISGIMDDGDLLYIPAAAITYDGSGNITAIAASSAVVAATEAEMLAAITASGFKTSTGDDASTSFDLSGLEIDPAGGTWTPASSGLTISNLLFAWSGYSNDGAVISTAGGGSIGMINGVPLASTAATQGDQIGLLPDSTGLGGLEGIALIPEQQHQLVLENYPVDLHTSTGTGYSWHRVELAGMTPNSYAQLFMVFGPITPGGAVPSTTAFNGEFFTFGPSAFNLLPVFTDAKGFGQFSITIPPLPALPGNNIVFQVVDYTTRTVSTPAAVQFI